MADTLRVSMWSGPRNLSTALMYSFRQRPDTTVVDEPLYGYYLAATGTEHPLRNQTMEKLPIDRDAAIATLYAPMTTPVVFFKNMAHHTEGIELDRFCGLRNAILTRDPRAVVLSLTAGFPGAELRHTGLPQSVALLDWMLARGDEPVVLDAGEILKDPRAVLTEWCRRIGLEFDEVMLSWPAGPKPEDGVWASHWYGSVHRSTGFGPYEAPPVEMPAHLEPLVEQCLPLYAKLMQHAITAGG